MKMIARGELFDDAGRQLPASSTVMHAPRYELFLRAFADECDALLGPAERDHLLRATGARLAGLLPVPPVACLEALQIEINDRLHQLGWGSVELTLHVDTLSLAIVHRGLPRLGAAGDPPGSWLAPVFEGLYQHWISDQPGGDASLVVRQSRPSSNETVWMQCACTSAPPRR